MKSLKKFRHIYSNIFICISFVILISLTFLSGSASVFSSANKLVPIYHGDKNSSNVTLMINVYWGTEYLEKMLSVLKKHEVKATFFIGGMWATKENEMLNKIKQDGHEIANHGYYHKDHDKISAERNREEISMTEQVIENICGTKTQLFMPPSGAFNQTTLKIAGELGYKTIMWSKDTVDWRDKNTTLIYNRATQSIEGGDLILMHPTLATSEVLEDIVISLKRGGWNLVTVSENLKVSS
ncbi:MAG: polysaccharide deacetylase family protein [Christensenellales bacterium]